MRVGIRGVSRRHRKKNCGRAVLVDGIDVTYQAIAADSRQGWVRVHDRLPAGGFYLGKDGNLMTRVCHGRVWVGRTEDARPTQPGMLIRWVSDVGEWVVQKRPHA